MEGSCCVFMNIVMLFFRLAEFERNCTSVSYPMIQPGYDLNLHSHVCWSIFAFPCKWYKKYLGQSIPARWPSFALQLYDQFFCAGKKMWIFSLFSCQIGWTPILNVFHRLPLVVCISLTQRWTTWEREENLTRIRDISYCSLVYSHTAPANNIP